MTTQNTKQKNNKDPESMVTDKALNIAQGIKQGNQTKTQTKLVAQGIGKGIELYKMRNEFQGHPDPFSFWELCMLQAMVWSKTMCWMWLVQLKK